MSQTLNISLCKTFLSFFSCFLEAGACLYLAIFLISFYCLLVSLRSYGVLVVKINEMILVPVLKNISGKPRPVSNYTGILTIKDMEF